MSQHADAFTHRIDHGMARTPRGHLLHRFRDLGALVGEILHHLDAMIEAYYGNFAILAGDQLVQHASDFLDFGKDVGEVGTALHRHHQRKRLIPDVRIHLLQFVVIVKFEILQLQPIHEFAIAVAHSGWRNHNVDAGSERADRHDSGLVESGAGACLLCTGPLGRIERAGSLSKSTLEQIQRRK